MKRKSNKEKHMWQHKDKMYMVYIHVQIIIQVQTFVEFI